MDLCQHIFAKSYGILINQSLGGTMKLVSTFLFLILSTQTFAAIGCLPGECEDPIRRPQPRRPRCESTTVNDFETLSTKRIIQTCGDCSDNEICAEYSNHSGEILSRECKSL